MEPVELACVRFRAALIGEAVQPPPSDWNSAGASDPDGEKIDVEAIVKPFRTRIDGLVSKNADVLREIEFQLPSSNGLKAKDTVDKLYRDREEGLPDRFNN